MKTETQTVLLIVLLAGVGYVIWRLARRDRAPESPMISVNQTARTDFGGSGGGGGMGMAGGFNPFSLIA